MLAVPPPVDGHDHAGHSPVGITEIPDLRVHNPSLDGLRFLAFLGVFFYHEQSYFAGLTAKHHALAKLVPLLDYGGAGVPLFFVLSGFLIGRILLDLRADSHIPLVRRLKTFYLRRGLRIFPVYYLLLLATAVLPTFGIFALGPRQTLPWHVLYLSNVDVFLNRGFPPMQGHLWTLSIEEHFYLIAPLLVLTMNLRRLSVGFVILWLACAASRVLCSLHGWPWVKFLSPFQFDCLTFGLAGAFWQTHGEFLGVRRTTFLRYRWGYAAVLVAFLALGRSHNVWLRAISDGGAGLFLSAAAAALILVLWNGRGAWNVFLAHPWLAYLGRISYGLYLFHFFIVFNGDRFVASHHWHHVPLPLLDFVTVVALASLSWHFFENPINSLKRRFAYR